MAFYFRNPNFGFTYRKVVDLLLNDLIYYFKTPSSLVKVEIQLEKSITNLGIRFAKGIKEKVRCF